MGTIVLIFIVLVALLAYFLTPKSKEVTFRDFIEVELMTAKAPRWVWWLLLFMVGFL